MLRMKRYFRRAVDCIGLAIGYGVGVAICEPQLRLGRRRHDGTCDVCGDSLGRYSEERLNFPMDDFAPEASTTGEKIRAMLDAEYECVCLPCGADIQREDDRQ